MIGMPMPKDDPWGTLLVADNVTNSSIFSKIRNGYSINDYFKVSPRYKTFKKT